MTTHRWWMGDRRAREEAAFDDARPDIRASLMAPAGQPGRAWCALLGLRWSPEHEHAYDEPHEDEMFCRCGKQLGSSPWHMPQDH